jgi:hypothetical protein
MDSRIAEAVWQGWGTKYRVEVSVTWSDATGVLGRAVVHPTKVSIDCGWTATIVCAPSDGYVVL